MTDIVGEANWLSYLDEFVRNASDLEKRVKVVELWKRAVSAEPGSLRIWLAYCNFFWSLWLDCQTDDAGWTEEEQMMGRELFSFGTALDLWQQAYEAIKFRLDDSHILWSRWISLEMDLLAKTKTAEGVKRITHLYRDRLMTPHLNWDDTSQMYSTFLSEYNRIIWEDSMKEITEISQDAKSLIAARDTFEFKLKQGTSAGDIDSQRAIMIEYLEWESLQAQASTRNNDIGLGLCHGLYARALTGIFAFDEAVWHEYIVFLSSSHTDPQPLENMLDALRRAVRHCPWSGRLWNRLILCAEEAKLDFAEVESIKHAATSENRLYKYGMESMIEMYVAWCGFLKRTAMNAAASDEAVDVADVGLSAALEDVEVVGKRLYGKDFQGDPKFRLERIYIQYLTEKKGAIDEARAQWNKLAGIQIHADNYDFWFRYYMWEMLIFSSHNTANKSPRASPTTSFRIPVLATAVLQQAAARTSVDWPEKVLEVYMQHCNDYEPSHSVRKATDIVQKSEKTIANRRALEYEQNAAAFSAEYSAHNADQDTFHLEPMVNSSVVLKRKRDNQVAVVEEDEEKRKRQRNGLDANDLHLNAKRDRENATIVVTKLPMEATQTKVRQYFKEYGHIINMTAFEKEVDEASLTAMIEFSSPDEARSALLRDGKYFCESQITVQSGHDLTVYVANYPPEANESYIRDLFHDCGKILSVRWPSLKVNTHRRFCYVSFSDREASSKAVQKDGLVLDGKYKLLAKYSDPRQKKNREGAVAEGREVRISELTNQTTESEIQEIFSKYGHVTRVNMPRALNGKGRGFAFIDFETPDQAREAVSALNHTTFRHRILHVEISKLAKVKHVANTASLQATSALAAPPTFGGENSRSVDSKPSNPTAAVIASRTIVVMGFLDTVNDARVLALVEPFGKVVKLTLQPSRGGAKIEFADSATAGKASLHLDNMEFEGQQLHIGSLDELRHAKVQKVPDRIVYRTSTGKQKKRESSNVVQDLIPRPSPRRPMLRKAGSKRGLAASPQELSAEASGATSRKTADDNRTQLLQNREFTSKSNADFKALFLNNANANKEQA